MSSDTKQATKAAIEIDNEFKRDIQEILDSQMEMVNKNFAGMANAAVQQSMLYFILSGVIISLPLWALWASLRSIEIEIGSQRAEEGGSMEIKSINPLPLLPGSQPKQQASFSTLCLRENPAGCQSVRVRTTRSGIFSTLFKRLRMLK